MKESPPPFVYHPVCLGDVPGAIFAELGLEIATPGAPVFAVRDSQARIRRFFSHINWNWGAHKGHRPAELGPLTEYVVMGFPWLDESWYPTYKRFTADGVETVGLGKYQFGDLIRFATTNSRASLTIPITQPHSEVELQLTFTPHISAGVEGEQRVTIFFNGKKTAEWTAANNEQSRRSVFLSHSTFRTAPRR